jgi:ribonuclease P/MRP protein subunit POP7
LKSGGVGGGVKEGEKVYLKATGRAIPRALELGVQFQGEDEGCVVKVEMGSVKAIDDLEVKSKSGGEDVVDEEEEDVPETRIRTISSVTVSIRMK